MYRRYNVHIPQTFDSLYFDVGKITIFAPLKHLINPREVYCLPLPKPACFDKPLTTKSLPCLITNAK